MRVIAWLVDLARYRDRALMFRAAASRLGGLRLVCSTPPPADFPSHPALEIIPLADRRMRRQRLQLRFLRWLRRQPTADILHDTQGFMAPAFALQRLSLGRLSPGRLSSVRSSPLRLTSNFASTWDWAQALRGRWPVEWREREVRYHTQWLSEFALARVSDAFTVFGDGHRAPFAAAYRVPLARIHSLPNCVAPDRFAPTAAPVDAAPRLLFVGAVFRYKGVHELIDAVARLRPRWPDLQVDLVGPLPDRAEPAVRAHLDAAQVGGQITVHGPVPRADLADRLARARAVVLPTYTEGSPRVIIEAMACGRPIIASDIPGIATLDPGRRFLRLVPRFAVGALADAIDATLRDPAAAEARGAAGRAHYLDAHTPEAAGAALVDLYRRLRP